MPSTSMFAIFLGAITLMLAPWSVVKAEPSVLTMSQLDGVTAGGVYVDVSTLVNALGDYARAVTEAQTTAVGDQGLDAGFGLGFGEGVACCGSDPEVHVQTEVSGAGDRVMGGTVSFFTHTGDMTLAFAFGWILAVSGPSRGEIPHAAMQGLPAFGRLAPMWPM
jgi:hypothetical protein